MALFVVYSTTIPCPKCDGVGYRYGEINGRVCEFCYSSGEALVPGSRLELHVPIWAVQDWASYIVAATRPASAIRRRRHG
jgi:hypothetical protein